MSEMSTGDLLRASAGYVRDGWTRFIRHDPHGACCALGAIENAMAGRRLMYQAMYAEQREDVVAALTAVIGQDDRHCGPVVRIATWNNGDTQTAENVALAFELAAVVVEAVEQSPIATPVALTV